MLGADDLEPDRPDEASAPPEEAAAPVGRDLARRLPPLGTILVAIVIALFVLPSSLNVPQSNPQTVAEFAPVPPSDDDTPPISSNANEFGLGKSGLAGDGADGDGDGAAKPEETTLPEELPDPPDLLPQAKNKSTKRCVGNPPRQTEDLLSPPCVANFDGDNGGTTYQGVTREEITLLIYEDVGGSLETSKGAVEESPPEGTYKSLDDAPADSDFISTRNNRIWIKYFNDRYQTYGRHVHGWQYWSGADTAEARRADAADNTSGESMPAPFAVIDQAGFRGFNTAYRDAMARRGVMQFTSTPGIPGAQLSQYKPLVWGFFPDVEHLADLYVSYVCQRVVPEKVSRTGNASEVGLDRVFGVWSTSDPAFPNLALLNSYVVDGVRKCGGNIVEQQYYPHEGYVVDNSETPDYAVSAVASFRQKKVTTVLWPGGVEAKLGQAAAQVRWGPEVFVLGTGNNDDQGSAANQQPDFWNHARALTSYPFQERPDESTESQAFRDAAGADYPRRDIRFAVEIYRDLYQTFRAIQVSGPSLKPSSVDAGFHAIPRQASKDPHQQAGFYDQGDYSYVKDNGVIWWDSSAENPHFSGSTGCWRVVEGGKRYLARTWGSGDDFTTGRATPDGACTSPSVPYKLALA